MNKFKTHLLALVAVLTVGFTAINPNPATAQSFVDTDGDGLNDRAEDRRCIGDAGQSRGGYVDEAGCTGEFVSCVQHRPNSYFTCGAPASFDDIGLKGFLDGLTYVVESNGTRHQLVHDHLPKWEGGRNGGWNACGDDSLILHVGDHALVKGKSVKTGLPSQTPPFCHPTVMKTSGAAGGGLDKKTREQISGMDTSVKSLNTLLIEDEERGFVATREKAESVYDAVNNDETGLAATHRLAQKTADAVNNPETGLAAAHKKADDLKAVIDDEEKGLTAVRESAFQAWDEVYVNNPGDNSRIDTLQGALTALGREVRGGRFFIETGYRYNGLHYITDFGERPALHGPAIGMGYRRTLSGGTIVARGWLSPYMFGSAGMSGGGGIGAAVRIMLPKPVLNHDGEQVGTDWKRTSAFIGGSVGGSGWGVGLYKIGNQGYVDSTGGGVDIDAILLIDAGNVVTFYGSAGVRVHAFKTSPLGDDVLTDFGATGGVQFRL